MRARKSLAVLRVLAAAAICAAFLFPFYIAVVNSLKTPLETARNALAPPGSFSLANFVTAARTIDFMRALLNSLIVTVSSVVLIVLSSSLCGYTLARHAKRSRALKALDKAFLASLMVPFQILMIPVYRIFKSIGLINNLLGMIIMLTGISVAFATFLYAGFVKSIPRELEEAAYLDGCGPYKTFFMIVFPLLKVTTATVASLHAMWLWNDFNISLILLQKESIRTITIKQFYFFSQYASDYNMAFAAAILSMIPILAFFLFAQKKMISGIVGGAMKG